MKFIIIEDEQPAAKRLQRLITDLRPGSEMLHVIDSVEEAVDLLPKSTSADLVFMDIQLADGLSFDIFSRISVVQPVIFTTAFDHYAVKAFKVNSIDYLLKPVETSDLENAITKFEGLHRHEAPDYDAIIRAIREQKEPYKKRFLVKTAGRLTFVNVEDIAWFFSEDGNSFLVTRGNDRFLIDNILEEVEAQLDPSRFFRISRKMIIALGAIKRIDPHFNNRFVLELDPGFEEEVIVSRQRSAEFRSWLDQ